MPRRKRAKLNGIIPHLANPSSASNPPRRKKKPDRSMPNTNVHIESACWGIIYRFIQSIMKHFVIPSFAANIIGCILSAYYLNEYIQINHFHTIQTSTNNELYLQIISYSITTLCSIFSIIFYSYLYLIIALILSPHGHDINSYSVGRSRFNPYRVYLFIYTCFQTFETLLYLNSYFYCVTTFLNKCKRESYDCDLNRLQYNEYSINTLKRIISIANNRCLDNIENEQRLQRNFLKQAHYDNIVKQDIKHIIKYSQTRATEMISIFNVHYDKNDSKQITNIFLPPSISLSMNYKNGNYKAHNYKSKYKNDNLPLIPPTPVVIFLVGGAWGSCDNTFSASAASSFINSKIAFIYPTFTIFPDGEIQDMLSNINAIIEWIIKYSNALNINPNHITIIGQSAGAHLGALTLLKAYQQKSKWLRRVRLFCGLAGPYCIRDHYQWESKRGIENISPMGRCMKGVHNFPFYSPSIICEEIYTSIIATYMNNKDEIQSQLQQISNILPHFLLIHSIKDYIVPIKSSRKFKQKLEKLNIKCEFEEYINGSHYDSLFGICDINNCLFNRLITDITSKIFICCTKYNKYIQMKRKFQKFQKSQKLKTMVSDDIKSDNKLYDIYEDIEEEDEEDDIINDSNSNSNSDSDSDIIQNENDKSSNDSNDIEVKENNNSDMDEFYEEEKEEIIYFKGYKYYEQTNEYNDENNKLGLKDVKYNKKNDINNTILPIAENLQIIEIIKENQSKNDIIEENDNDNDDDDDNDNDNDWADCDLFTYDDASLDIDKSDEAIQFMKHLLKDMDIALDEISNMNNMTKGQIDKINES